MAVLVEAFSVIVRRDAIAQRFKGGWKAFLDVIPNATGCYDSDLVRVGFMEPGGVKAFVSELEAGGLAYLRNGQAVDMAVADQIHGIIVPAPWLEFGRIELFDPPMKVAACWLAGKEVDGVALPPGWTYEDSLSKNSGYVEPDEKDEKLKFLRHEGGMDVYRDLSSGKEVFVANSEVKGYESQGDDLFAQLEKICERTLVLAEKSESLKASGNVDAAMHVFGELQDILLPAAARIAHGPGCNMGFAHFVHGLVLRTLSRPVEAEVALRKSNELQPDPGVLAELVRCLGEQGKNSEALSFARKAVEVAPMSAAAWGNLAACLFLSGAIDEARMTVNYAVALDPHNHINLSLQKNLKESSKQSKFNKMMLDNPKIFIS